MQDQEFIESPAGLKLNQLLNMCIPRLLRSQQSHANLIQDGIERVWPKSQLAITLTNENGYHVIVERRYSRHGRMVRDTLLEESASSAVALLELLSFLFPKSKIPAQ